MSDEKPKDESFWVHYIYKNGFVYPAKVEQDFKVRFMEQKRESEWIPLALGMPVLDYKVKKILILVNGFPRICEVFDSRISVFYKKDLFVYLCDLKKFHSDDRFAEPTHWMPIPEVPK
jgi:hypothetical protein